MEGGPVVATDDQVDELFIALDTDKDGYLSVRDWLNVFQQKTRAKAEGDDDSEKRFRMRSANNDRIFEEVLARLSHAVSAIAQDKYLVFARNRPV